MAILHCGVYIVPGSGDALIPDTLFLLVLAIFLLLFLSGKYITILKIQFYLLKNLMCRAGSLSGRNR
jgi:hypothetical protein